MRKVTSERVKLRGIVPPVQKEDEFSELVLFFEVFRAPFVSSGLGGKVAKD